MKDQKSFASLSSSGGVSLLAPEKFKTYDQNKFYWGLFTFDHGHRREVKVESYTLGLERNGFIFGKAQFFGAWLQDESPREYDKVDSIPPSRRGGHAPPGVFNLWPGFSAERLPGARRGGEGACATHT